MNKTEIQARIEKCESELATLKADLAQAEFAKCDCAEGIEQEKCWQVLSQLGEVITTEWRNKNDAVKFVTPKFGERAAYMPECRQVTAEDALDVWSAYCHTSTSGDMARELHKLGFRMKVINP